MLIANGELKFGGKILEPGLPIPSDHGMSPHILDAHLSRRSIVDVDQERANDIRARYLKAKRDSEAKIAQRLAAQLEADVAAARAAAEREATEALAAESRLLAIVQARREAKAKAQVRLDELNAKLAELTGVTPAAPVSPAPVPPAAPSAVASAPETPPASVTTETEAPRAAKSPVKGRRTAHA